MSSSDSSIEEILPNFKPGPLDKYRKCSSFNWRDMTLVMEDEETLRFKFSIWKRMEEDPLFAHSTVQPSLGENRDITLERALRFSEIIPKNPPIRINAEIGSILGQYDWSVSLRRAIMLGFFTNSVRGLGTEKHMKYIDAAENHELMGCVAMTEVGHGTNTKGFRTTCTYDPVKQKFILNTPDFEAAKCWAGNLAKTANYAYVLAQLICPKSGSSRGIYHGLHGFIVKIRDEQMNLMPGVLIGDMGEKLGLNGLDNGFMTFDNYEVDADCLLNKIGDVDVKGKYVSQLRDSKQRFSASLGSLSGPRVGIVVIAAANMCNAITISVRYSAVRRQFGSPEELPVIEYQMQQCRLFPYLAASYVFKFFGRYLFDILIEFIMSQYSLDITAKQRARMGAELHVISSGAKAVAGWLSRDAIQESREACGGHGYLSAAGIGRLRNDGDAFLTFEGDNNVLLQQTSNWLLSVWSNPKNMEKLVASSPFGALNFMRNAAGRLKKRLQIKNGKKDLKHPDTILRCYKWLACYVLRETSVKFKNLCSEDKSTFDAKNDSQMFYARTLSIVFVEQYVIEIFWKQLCCKEELSSEIRAVLQNLLALYGLWSMEKHMGIFYEGGYFTGPNPSKFIKDSIVELCGNLKSEAVALVDAIAPTDFILNSVLGSSDGQVYKRLENIMRQTPGCFERSKKWEILAEKFVAKL